MRPISNWNLHMMAMIWNRLQIALTCDVEDEFGVSEELLVRGCGTEGIPQVEYLEHFCIEFKKNIQIGSNNNRLPPLIFMYIYSTFSHPE